MGKVTFKELITFLALTTFFVCTISFINFHIKQAQIVYQTIAREASNQSIQAQAYVAKVIRVRSEERGLSYAQVCLEPYQFSCWNKGVKQVPRTRQELKIAKKAWKLSKDIRDKVNMYHDTSVTPKWVKKVKFVRQIDDLRFYYEER